MDRVILKARLCQQCILCSWTKSFLVPLEHWTPVSNCPYGPAKQLQNLYWLSPRPEGTVCNLKLLLRQRHSYNGLNVSRKTTDRVCFVIVFVVFSFCIFTENEWILIIQKLSGYDKVKKRKLKTFQTMKIEDILSENVFRVS